MTRMAKMKMPAEPVRVPANKKSLMLRIQEDIYAQLDAYCLEEGHTKTWVIEKALMEYLRDH